MPRRSTRTAAPSQDDIEVDDQENEPSQQESVQDADQPMDSVAEKPEQNPPRRSKKSNATSSKSKGAKVKTEKNNKSRTRRDASDDERDSKDDLPGPPFDRDDFLATARPIPPEGAENIDGVISDLQTVLHQLDHTGFELVLDTAVAVEEAAGNTEEGQEVWLKIFRKYRWLISILLRRL